MSRGNWDSWFLGLATYVASASKDPSTKVGAVIARPDRTVASIGFNGFPRGVDDDPRRYADRPTKYKLVCHAEANAIVSAREPLHGCSIYVAPFPPCSECAKLIIQAGIKRVVAPIADVERWRESFATSSLMFGEAGVEVDFRDT